MAGDEYYKRTVLILFHAVFYLYAAACGHVNVKEQYVRPLVLFLKLVRKEHITRYLGFHIFSLEVMLTFCLYGFHHFNHVITNINLHTLV